MALIDEAIQNLDETMEGSEGLNGTFGKEGDELKAAREKFVAGPLTKWLNRIEAMWTGAPFFLPGDKPSVVDLWLLAWFAFLFSGALDFVPAETGAKFKKISASIAAVMGIPTVAEFYKQHPQG